MILFFCCQLGWFEAVVSDGLAYMSNSWLNSLVLLYEATLSLANQLELVHMIVSVLTKTPEKDIQKRGTLSWLLS